MTPAERYRLAVRSGGAQPDEAQARAASAFQQLFDALLESAPAPGALARLARAATGNVNWPPVRGLYLWGDVGRGKTWLMDAFHDTLPFEQRNRVHFHRFMLGIHDRLKKLGPISDPLAHVARELASAYRVICLDELFVSDIADAMILGRLFDGLFSHGVTLVATSNTPPDGLYAGGLQRQRFLPAIEALKAHTRPLRMDGDQDYRLQVLEAAALYLVPADAQAETALEAYFCQISPDEGATGGDLEILNRPVPTRRLGDGVVWFDFDVICGGPRSQADYVELAMCYQTVLVSGVPVLEARLENEARRFIALVDEFYDRNVKLIVSAGAPIEALYRGKRFQFEFRRTISRLTEMQSHDFLARPHLP